MLLFALRRIIVVASIETNGSALDCYVPPARIAKKSARMAVSRDDVTAPTESASLPSPRTSVFRRVKELELDLGKARDSRYRPADHTNSEVLKKAMLEFGRRLQEEDRVDADSSKVIWVLVSTSCGEIPHTCTVQKLLRETQLDEKYGGVKFCVTEDGCLFIISFSDKIRHGEAVSALMDALLYFNRSVAGRGLFFCHTNTLGEADGNRTAPDAALKKIFPLQPDKDHLELRAPFIAEVHSTGKSVFGSLTFLSSYLDAQHSDYVMYIRIYDKDAAGNFAAVAILWRGGQGVAPLGDGVMATLVQAQSFGTKALHQDSINAFGDTYGHLPGVPANQLVLQPPANITIPRAQLLHNVQTVEGAPFVPDLGPDLVVELEALREHLTNMTF